MDKPRRLFPADTPVLWIITTAGAFQDKTGATGQGLQSRDAVGKNRKPDICRQGFHHGIAGTIEEVRDRSHSSIAEICRETEEGSRNLIISSGGTLANLLNALTGQEEDGCIMPHGTCVVIRENDSNYEKMGSYEL